MYLYMLIFLLLIYSNSTIYHNHSHTYKDAHPYVLYVECDKKVQLRNHLVSLLCGHLMYIFFVTYNIFLFCSTNIISYFIYEPKARCLLHQIFLLGLESHYGTAAMPLLSHSHSISHLFLFQTN